MKNFIVLLLILPSFLFNSCDFVSYQKKNDCMNDSLISDVPFNKLDTQFLRLRDKIELLAGLTKIDTGFDGLQIRIGYAYSSDVEHLIILTNEKEKWVGTLNTLKFNYKDLSDSLISINRTTKNVVPKSGWKIFTDSLISMGILELPDMTAVTDYELATDGSWFTVDFAKCRKYRYYSYQSPWGSEDKFWQAKKVVNISRLIEEELNFERFQKNQN